MDGFFKNLGALIIRSFIPTSPFYTNFLVESKKFTNLDVSNRIAPYFFFSSFFAVFFCKTILHQVGIEKSSILVSAIFFINLIFLLNLQEKNLPGARMIYFSSGFITTFDMVLRFYISETNTRETKADARYAYLSSLRAISTSFSSCVGQEIVNRTRYYEIPIHVSIFTQFLSFLLSIYSFISKEEENEFVDIKTMDAMLSMNKIMLCAFMAGIVSNCFNIFIRFFAQSIFRDKEFNKENILNKQFPEDNSIRVKTTQSFGSSNLEQESKISGSDKQKIEIKYLPDDRITATSQSNSSINSQNRSCEVVCDEFATVESNNFRNNSNSNLKDEKNNLHANLMNIWDSINRILHIPIALVAKFCITVVVAIFPKYSQGGNAQKKYLNGDIDALTNVMCYFGSYMIVSNVPKKYKEILYISFLLLSSIYLFAMARSKNKFMLYFMYILTGIFSKACNQITKVFLKKQQNDNNLIVGGFIVETIVHMVVNQSCKFVNATSLTKTIIYSLIGIATSIGIIYIKSKDFM